MAIFCDIDLAARIEAAETALVCAAASATPGTSAQVLEIGSGAAAWAGPDSPFNKVVGLGFDPTLDADGLTEAERLFARNGAATVVELSTLARAEVAPTLAERGYRAVAFEDVLGLRVRDGSPARGPDGVGEEVEVRRAGDDELDLFLETLIEGFAVADDEGVASREEFPREALRRSMQALAEVPGFRAYLAEREGEVVGAGALRLHEGVASLCGAATLARFRRQGVQTRLLAERLRLAAADGCELAAVATQPGSASKRNVQRAGFDPLYSRVHLLLRSDDVSNGDTGTVPDREPAD